MYIDNDVSTYTLICFDGIKIKHLKCHWNLTFLASIWKEIQGITVIQVEFINLRQ